MQIPIAEAKAKFAELVSRAELGEDIVLTRNGRPVARLSRLAPQPLHYGDLRHLPVADDLSLPDDVIATFAEPVPPTGQSTV